jgi:hypothetical protein
MRTIATKAMKVQPSFRIDPLAFIGIAWAVYENVERVKSFGWNLDHN